MGDEPDEPYVLTEDVDLTDQLNLDKCSDIISIIVKKDGSQTLEGMDKLARNVAAPETLNKGLSVWWSVPEAYSTPILTTEHRDKTVVGWEAFADARRGLLQSLQRAVVVCEKMIPEDVEIDISTRRSGDMGQGATVGGDGGDTIPPHYYCVSRYPARLRKLAQASDDGYTYTSARDMLKMRAKNGYAYHVSYRDDMRLPCWGDVVQPNPLWVGSGFEPDNPRYKYLLMPHMHVFDAQMHMEAVDGATG